MSSIAGKNLKRKQISYLMIFFFLFGCTSPDSWYDIENIYVDNTALNKSIPVDTKLLPEPEWQESLPLPQAEDGRITLSLEQAVFFSLKRNRELQVERYAPLIIGTFEQIERGV